MIVEINANLVAKQISVFTDQGVVTISGDSVVDWAQLETIANAALAYSTSNEFLAQKKAEEVAEIDSQIEALVEKKGQVEEKYSAVADVLPVIEEVKNVNPL